MMEDSPLEAICTNVGGTKLLADLSIKYGGRTICNDFYG
jgi:FlaA1/EpsC-like NDP-sugar epimerase